MAKTDTTIDKDLYDGLQQARKKKPRYFALIAKGADVVGLIVQKKVINDGAAQKAKSESKGTLVIQGVCCGEGADLKFEVEGKEPSIQPKKIKDFIEEQTDLTLKPYWSVVTQLSGVEDEEAPPAATATASGTPPVAPPSPASQPPPTANAPPPPPPPPPKPPVDAKGLQARLKTLLTRQRDLFEKNSAFREKFLKFSQPAASLTMSGSADAPAALDKLEQALDIAERATQQPAQPTPQPPASATSESQAAKPKASEPTIGEPKTSDLGAEWKEKLAQWLPAIKVAIDAKGPTTDAIRKLFAEASALSKASLMSKPGSDMALAIEKLKECHTLATTPTDQAAATSQKSPEPQAAKAEIAAALKRHSAVMQGALDQAGAIEKASADLDQLGAALAGSLKDEGEEGEGEEEKEAAAELLERVLDVQAQAASLPEPAKKELQKRVRQLQVAIGSGDAASLAADVDALENDLARASGAARVSEANTGSSGRVSFRKLELEWRDAQAKSRKQLDQFVAAFLADQEVQADPRFAQISVAASEIAKQMPMFGNELEDALDAIDDAADDAARAKARTGAQKILANYSKTLDGAEGLHELQALADDDFGGISFVSELQLALDKLGAQLASAA